MISKNYLIIFIALNYKALRTIITIITDSKVTELFYMADDFCINITKTIDTQPALF